MLNHLKQNKKKKTVTIINLLAEKKQDKKTAINTLLIIYPLIFYSDTLRTSYIAHRHHHKPTTPTYIYLIFTIEPCMHSYICGNRVGERIRKITMYWDTVLCKVAYIAPVCPLHPTHFVDNKKYCTYNLRRQELCMNIIIYAYNVK